MAFLRMNLPRFGCVGLLGAILSPAPVILKEPKISPG